MQIMHRLQSGTHLLYLQNLFCEIVHIGTLYSLPCTAKCVGNPRGEGMGQMSMNE